MKGKWFWGKKKILANTMMKLRLEIVKVLAQIQRTSIYWVVEPGLNPSPRYSKAHEGHSSLAPGHLETVAY